MKLPSGTEVSDGFLERISNGVAYDDDWYKLASLPSYDWNYIRAEFVNWLEGVNESLGQEGGDT